MVTVRGNPQLGRLVSNAGSLFAATVVTSLLGFAFWAVAARLASPTEVGAASAAVAAMQVLGSLGSLGLGTLLIGELARGAAVRGLVVGSLQVAAVAAAVAGLVTGAVLHVVAGRASWLYEPGWPLALFVVGTSLTGLTIVYDQALVAENRPGRQLARNGVFSAVKLLLLPALAVALGLDAAGIYLAWALGNVVSALAVVRPRARDLRLVARPQVGALRGMAGSALAHHLMNVASHAPLPALSVIVAATLGPELNAAFYAATLLVTFGWIIPVHLATALFGLQGHDREALRHGLRLSLLVTAGVTVGGTLLCLVAAPLVLRLFGPGYQQAATCLTILAAGTLLSAIKSLYTAVCRVEGRLARAAGLTAVGSVVEIAAGWIGTRGGLTGVAVGLTIAMALEAVIFTPTVARAAR